EPELENHDRGLDWDLPRLLQRRGLLKLVAGAGLAGTALVTLGACADNGSNSDTAATPGSDGSPAGAPGGRPRPAVVAHPSRSIASGTRSRVGGLMLKEPLTTRRHHLARHSGEPRHIGQSRGSGASPSATRQASAEL
ncbi:MAG TPA: hypothetical protein VE476_00900, partial [Propionibacteriaceae bacterium]|nr:hypothetical protein [Propionibacteriaceae bacterium]